PDVQKGRHRVDVTGQLIWLGGKGGDSRVLRRSDDEPGIEAMSLRQLHHLVRQLCRPLQTTTFHADPALDEQRISAAVRTLRKAELLYPVVRPGNRRVRSTD